MSSSEPSRFKKTLRCWLIGNRGLLIQCAEALLERGHEILGVTTNAADVASWATRRSLATTQSAAPHELLSHLTQLPVDLLLSIGNDEILKPDVLRVPSLAAVNYHDGPLPRYAGVHSTTWALLAGESQHGITWHRMTADIDDGAILAQRMVSVEPQDTAFLLNLKCHQAGFESFIDLLSLWEAGATLPEMPQDLSQRTVCRRFDRPPQALVLYWTQPAIALERLCRATNFGPRANAFGVARLWSGSAYYLVLEASAEEWSDSAVPGTILVSTHEQLIIAAAVGALCIRRLATSSGNAISEMPVWPSGSILPLLTPSVAELLTTRYRRSLQVENERLILYSQYPALQVPEYYGPSGLQTASQQISLAIELAETVQARVKQPGGVNFLLAVFAVLWQRKGAASPYRLDAYFPLEEGLAGLFSSSIPIFININRDASIGEACDIAYQTLCRAQQQGPLLLDMFFRYPDHSAPTPAQISVSVNSNPSVLVANTSALHFSISPDGNIMQLLYATDRIAPESAERIVSQFARFALVALEDPSKPLRAVPLLNQEEQDCVLYKWNDTVVSYPLHLSIVDLFVENAKKSPESIAVVYEGTILTYEELNRRSAQLAAHLSANGVGCGTLVGVFLDRSAELMVALLGILKAGGTYIPLDPSYPDVRLEQILEDTGARFLVTESALNNRLVHRPHFVFCQDTDRFKLTEELSDFLFSHPLCQPESPAYLIYTSGSTGKPKGVPIPHRGLTNLMFAYAKRMEFSAHDCLMAISSIGFDWSVADLFLPLAHGARLEILPSDVIRDGQQLAERIEKGTVTFIQGTPGAWRLMLAGGWRSKRPITLASGGEAMSVELAAQIQQRVNKLFNVYGPTETTVVSCGEEVSAEGPIHLGRPLDNYRQYLLDNDLNPVGIGEVGEICIAGPGVSPGYHRLPDLNAEKFCLDPFRSDTGEMLYRSGDLGRFLPNGRIQFVSRKDQQIKLRGFRIEPAEIESRLLADPEIRDCVVVLREEMPGQPRLVGFVVVADTAVTNFSTEKHLDRLRQNLPSYMVPSSLVRLSKLPVTVNKKIDRRRLSVAPLNEITEAETTTGPEQEPLTNRDETQRKLIVIVASILGVSPEQVRSDSHFAELGLDSIQLTRLAWRIKNELGIRIEVTVLYKFPTPRRLSSYLVPEQIVGQKPDLLSNLASELTAEAMPELTVSDNAIAIIGMAVRVSGANDLDQFWRVVTSNETQIQHAPEYRKFPKAWYGSFLEDIDCFDAAFFGISPDTAVLLDPQQRILLETCWHAFEDAGEQPATLSGSAVGVFVALPSPEYQVVLDQAGVAQEGFGVNALTGSVAANRISWTFNLTGPSEVIDTGCSSSLIAIHRAVKALQSGECQMAVVAGVNLLLSPDRFASLEANDILSKNGIPSPFGESGNGLVRGEGVGVIVLKPGTKAESDGNRIHGFIKGTAVAHGGRTTSLAGPNPAAQAATIRAALRTAAVAAESVTYVEAQGSGVPIGDHYEWSAFRDAFTAPGITPRQISTCKPHIGHLECAAGIISTIKAVLAFRYGAIPGVLNSEQLHTDLEQDASRFALARKNVEWSSLFGEKRRAGVHGFGYGGTIAHVVLEEPPVIKPSLPAKKREVVLLSARNSEGLQNIVRSFIVFLRSAPATPLAHLAYTLRVGRDSLPHRLAFVVDSAEQLCEELERYLSTNTALYAGVVSNSPSAATSFFEDPEAAALLESWILRQRWEQLASLWVQGATIPWHRTPRDGAKRIALPLYPFRKERHWIAPSQPCTLPSDSLREQVLKMLPIESTLEENSNLFSLGIDSLGALRLLRQIAPDSSHRLPLNEFFADPTLRGLRRLVSGQSSATTEFPLSAIQRFFWETEQLHPETAAWHSPFAFRLDSRVNRSRLRDALEALVKQYSILRSQVVVRDADVFQQISALDRFDLPIFRMSKTDWHNELRAAVREPFPDLPIRASLYEISSELSVLLITAHHRILDGISSRLLLQRLESAYAALDRGDTLDLPPDRPYEHFVAYERKWLQSREAEKDREWWRTQFPTGIPSLYLPTSTNRQQRTTKAGASLRREIAPKEWNVIVSRCQDLAITPAISCLTAWALLLSRRTNQSEFVVTVPVAGRPLAKFEEAIGTYFNLVPLRIEVSSEVCIESVWTTVQKSLADALDHSALPLPEILNAVRTSAAIADKGVNAAFYGQTWIEPSAPNTELKITAHPVREIMQEGEIDLALEMLPLGDISSFHLKYDPSLFSAVYAERLLDQFTTLLEATLFNPKTKAAEVSFISSTEYKLLTETWNNTEAVFPFDSTVHELFRAQARRSPEALAIIAGDHRLSYRELNVLSDQIAANLRNLKVAGQTIGVLLDRTVHLPAVLLGILKSDAVYLPLDPAFPAERLRFILADSGSSVMITQTGLVSTLATSAVRCLLVEDLLSECQVELHPAHIKQDIAYLIYTSGSSGQPKGTLIPHRALTNFLFAMQERLNISASDRLFAITTISFDIAALELFLPLVCGASVEIAAAMIARDGLRLKASLESQPITVFQATPSTYHMLLEAGWHPSLRLRLLCGGETLPADLAEDLQADGAELWNLYGPTEATVWMTAKRMEPGGPITIGSPIANTKAYVLDDQLQVVPIGITGELYISGKCLAAGYHQRDELNKKHFILNPFEEGYLYRAGDLARWTSEGELELLGRADQQIKLRGVRIEIGEIESALRRLPGVQNAAVALRKDAVGHEQLIAFLQRTGPPGDRDAERAELRRWLPEVMLPARFIEVSDLPLTPNRKLDRRALSALPVEDLKQAPRLESELPRTSHSVSSLQSVLISTIAEVAGLLPEQIDPHHHLGEYGLDSVRFTKLAIQLSRKLQRSIEPPIFYQYTTLAQLETHLGRKTPISQNDLIPSHRQPSDQDAVAIVGMSGIFPQSADLDEFWNHLIQGHDLITEVPGNRWNATELFDPNGAAGRSSSKWGSFIENIDTFDAGLFGISPREAEQMDPQQRLLLQCAWRLFEDAGHQPADFAGTRCGVYIGASGFDYNEFVWNCSPRIEGHTLSGLSHAVLANRISYLFDLRGPSAALDTACSSSLVAVHRAASAIRSGECESAIAGGVSVILSPTSYIALSQTRMLSPDGRCKTFDASADGYVRGEGAALLLLRPLHRALAEGDRVLGIIRASVENHGGRTNSLTAPSASSQAELVVSAFGKAQIDPRTVTYLEAHGTGTSLGDPIEINALKEAFATLYQESSLPIPSTPTCGVGSLKTNFGHLEAAAGVAGVIKVLLAMRHGRLPGLLHHRTINPMIHLEDGPFRLVTQAEPWLTSPGPDGIPAPRRAGVSSFGFGGSNAHIVLEEYPASTADSIEQGPWAFPLSAADPARLVAQCHALGAWLQAHPKAPLRDVAFTLQQGRASLPHRVVFISGSHDNLIHSLINADDDVFGKRIILEAADKTVQTVAEQWLQGVAVVWPHIRQAQRLSLPGHPFEQTRYWLSPALAPVNAPAKSTVTTPAVTQNAGTQKLRLRLPTPIENRSSLNDNLASPDLSEARSISETPASVLPQIEKSETTLIQRLRHDLADVLYTNEQQIDINRSFIDLGVDSILGIEFVRKLSTELGCTVKAADLYDYPNIEALAKYLDKLPVVTKDHVAPVDVHGVPQAVADPTAMQTELSLRLREILARVLYAETSKIAFQKSFADLGVDSILSVEFVRDLNREFGVSLSAAVLYDYPQLDTLVEYLASLLGSNNHSQTSTLPSPNAASVHQEEDPFSVQKSESVRLVGPQAATNAIAIIGCSGRFPQALNLHQFWNNLEEAKCSITTFPPDRRNGNSSVGKTWYGGFLDDIDRFDPLFFNISPADAELIDPQQRLFLIEAYRAIEDAGYAPEQLSGHNGGIFAGVTGSDRYAEMLPAERPAQEMMGNAASILAGRVAFFLDFRGPALTVDTACSSSLVAIHLACRSLLSGETDFALAGGITLYLSEKAWIEMDHAGMLASDGRCKTFDNRADGFVPGEGVGVLLLKRLDQALADGDTVRAVILGTSVNQDGRTNGLTAPSAKSQAALEVQTYRSANIDPSTISYVEAHGTGTKLGDPIEVEALTRAFREWTDARQFCAIGSVKTNIGHTTAAAGVAGVLKVIGAIERKKIPPSLHFEVPNEHISFAQSPFFVNRTLKSWEQMNNQARRAAISSFGFSGTNCHLVMEEPPLPALIKQSANTSQLYVVSGKTPGALSRHISQIAHWLGTVNGLCSSADVAFTLARGRSQFSFRAAFVADSLTQLLAQLQSWKPSLQSPDTDTPLGKSADQIAHELMHQTEPSKRRVSLQLLSDLFIGGRDLPMNVLFPDRSGKRISLPTYSFEQERCWGVRIPPISPALETNLPQLWIKRFSAADPIARDHQVGGSPILPGTAILLAVHEAISQIRSQNRYDIADLLWVEPVHVPKQGVDLQIELVRSDFDWKFQARSGSGVNSRIHAEGRLTPFTAQLENSSWPAAISATSVEPSKFYSSMERLQVKYGPAYQQITSLSVDGDYAFACLVRRSKMDPLPDPATFDAALQLVGALANAQWQGEEIRPMLPFALERCAFLSAWPNEAKIRARRAGTDKFDVQVLDQNNQVCVSIAGLALRRSNVPQSKPVVQTVITEAKLPGITPEVWTEADSGRYALNRYARLLARQTVPLLERYPDQIRPNYQSLVKAVFEIADHPAHTTLAQLREDHPELKDAFALLDHCAAALPAVAYGEQLGTAVLFSPDRVSLLESIYAGNPIARATNAAVGTLVAKASPASILEFGAGTGATSRAVVKALQGVGHVPSRYLFTDISTVFFDKARSEFPQFEFARFDISRPPEEQGFPLSGFDVVVGTNVLHVVTSLSDALHGLRSLLRPGGVLILNEATSVEDYAVLTFGLTSGWWQAAGESVRLSHSPLLSSAAWIEQLHRAGFETPQEWTAERAFYGSSGQSIFIASAPSTHEPAVANANDEENSARGYVRQVLARVLKLAPERIENTIAFENYGVDSLVVLEINRAFEKDLGRLPATLLFENMTVNALAAYFLRQHDTALRKVIHNMSDAPKSQLPIPAVPVPQFPKPALDERIAIIAVSGRYPLSPDLDSLWENLAAGRSGVRSVPDERWKWQNATGLKQSSAQERKAGYLNDVDCFDPLHFGISPREAVAMDPQQRLFLQVAAAALECAGYTQQRLSAIENRVGVFAGVMSADYEWLAADAAAAGIPTEAHSAYWSIANRVSYCLNLQGPSLAVDTACSASLSAVHLACESLRRGECRAALAGGVNLILHPRHLERLEQAGMLSPSDCCRSFGAEANGFADGEGVGVVLLKPLKAAVEDGDTIWGVVLGSAVNAGGRTGGFTVPNPAAQASAIRDAISRAAIDPQSISYIEAHGTGTSLGDPIEIAGLQQVFSDVMPGSCSLGSVKSNFGHLEAAAGILGLTKILLQMRHQRIVPTLHADLPNPLIEWHSLPFRLNQSLTAWNSQSGKRRASISSFGAGGANAHLIVEEFLPSVLATTNQANTQLIVLSARDTDRLAEYKKNLVTFLERNPDISLTHLAWNLQAGREAYAERIAMIVSTPAELLAALHGDTPQLVMEKSRVRTIAHQEQSFIQAALQSRDLKALAGLWLSGVTIDWTSLYSQAERRWIPVPTYPFARERYWLPVHNSSSRKNESNSELNWLYEPQWVTHELEDVKFSPVNGRVLLVISPAMRHEIPLEQWKELHAASHFSIAELDPNNPDSLAEQLTECASDVKCIYFLTGLAAEFDNLLDPVAVAQAQEYGVLTLFRLIKFLRRNGLSTLQLAVLTLSVHTESDHPSSPLYASLSGFVRSLRREFPDWQACCFDVDRSALANTPVLLDWIAAEWQHHEWREVARWRGRRRVRTLCPIRSGSSAAKPKPWRTGGTYLILGGAGGLGLETAHYLARTARAKLILLGRSRLSEKQQSRIADIEQVGGEVLYLQTDATDEVSLASAIQRGREHFGTIHGAFHSALVLEDRTIDRMDEAAFRKVLMAKVATSVLLARALASEPLDFLVFFSSAESFAGDAGQSNYSAGCVFQDAYAAALRKLRNIPAKTVNWGYWGSVGAVASADYRARLTRQGLISIDPEEGMQVIETLLTGQAHQILAVKGNDTVLSRLGISPITVTSQDDFLALLRLLETAGRHKLLSVLRSAGAVLDHEQAVSTTVLRKMLRIAPSYEKLFDALLDVLHRAGILHQTPAGWILLSTTTAAPPLIAGQLPAHEQLLDRALQALPSVLSGHMPGIDVLFDNKGAALVSAMYQGDPVTDHYNRLVAACVRDFASSPAVSSRSLRILEIGAGTGGTTASVLPVLTELGQAFEYTYTDISPAFLRQGREMFSVRYPNIEFKLLNIENEPESQGYSREHYDLIVATNVLHATRDLLTTLRHVKSLLNPKGCLVLNEATEQDDYLTMTFGLLPGWWAAEDVYRRLPHSPLASRDSWCAVLAEADFKVEPVNNGLSQRVFRAIRRDFFTTPQSGIETTICDMLAQVLEIPPKRIASDTPFLEIGLDSLTAIDVVRRINNQLGSSLKSMDLYNYPTVEKLSDRLRQGQDPSRESTFADQPSLLQLLDSVAGGSVNIDDAVMQILGNS